MKRHAILRQHVFFTFAANFITNNKARFVQHNLSTNVVRTCTVTKTTVFSTVKKSYRPQTITEIDHMKGNRCMKGDHKTKHGKTNTPVILPKVRKSCKVLKRKGEGKVFEWANAPPSQSQRHNWVDYRQLQQRLCRNCRFVVLNRRQNYGGLVLIQTKAANEELQNVQLRGTMQVIWLSIKHDGIKGSY